MLWGFVAAMSLAIKHSEQNGWRDNSTMFFASSSYLAYKLSIRPHDM